MISVTIIVKNGERCLRHVLRSLKNFDEIIVADTGSTDSTEKIALEFNNVRFCKIPFEGFGKAHNHAASLAKHEWILSIDSDEVLSDALANEILNLQLNEDSVYAIPFHNYYNEKWIKGCGWYPETHVRLYNRGKTQFSEALVHEKIMAQGLTTIRLQSPLFHYSYSTISDFLMKMEHYSTLFAKQYVGKKTSSPRIAFWHAAGAFLKSYLLKRGFLLGHEGFLISIYNSQTAFYKYLKLYHLNKK